MRDYSRTIFELLEYEGWCNLQSADLLATLSEEERKREFGFGLGTPHRTITHIADVMRGWGGCIGPEPQRPVWRPYDKNKPLAEIRQSIAEVAAASLSAARASRNLGLLDHDRRLHHLFHLVTHGTHHRGQLLSMLTLLGYPQPFEGGDFGGWSNRQTRLTESGTGRDRVRRVSMTITPELVNSANAIALIEALDAELLARYGPHEVHGLCPSDADDPTLLFLVASIGDLAVACGALRQLEPEVGEIKRMYVRPKRRGQGIARQLLAMLEFEARERGYNILKLETGIHQPEAIGLYESAGFQRLAAFGEYVNSPSLSVCFQKILS
jgi:putative acetyltransferase